MKLHLNLGDQRFLIQNYGETHITLNNQRHTTSLILTPEQRLDWLVNDVNQLTDELLTPLLSDDPELIVLGTGHQPCIPSPAVMRFFARHGLGLEFVNTPTACRIYNILASEGRRVGCGLILPGRFDE
ncbi:MAG: MTH938/NDUFAF3 family protein [Halothiobacillaceae bacterium]|nr:MTH938/NDUFAF3 family protein [Halothiobacillaceae bacterium]